MVRTEIKNETFVVAGKEQHKNRGETWIASKDLPSHLQTQKRKS